MICVDIRFCLFVMGKVFGDARGKTQKMLLSLIRSLIHYLIFVSLDFLLRHTRK